MKKLTLVELSNTAHKNLKIKNNAVINFAAKQHLMNLRATEIAQAATCYPVFATKNTHNGFWSFSSMTSFVPDMNLFVKDGKLDAIYRPTSIQTYPLYLMTSPKDEKSYTIGIVDGGDDFSEKTGEALFEDDGKPSAATQRRIQILEADVKKDIQTAQFSTILDQMGLFKPIDMNIRFLSGEVQKLKGLHTIDEDKLLNLSVEDLDKLRKEGYLMPIYAMLVSIMQVNKLINLSNEVVDRAQIVEVKMEAAKNTDDA